MDVPTKGEVPMSGRSDEDQRRVEAIERLFDWPVLIAAFLVIPVFLIQGNGYGSPWNEFANVANWISWSTFLVEVVVMLKVGGWRWAKSNPLPIVVTLITPPFLPAALASARFLRFIRLIRLFPGATAAKRLFSLDGLKYAAVISLLTVIIGGIVFARVEPNQSPDDGIWWAVTTMTTVGYGDLAPTTGTGRFLAGLVMLVGLGFAALVTAFLAERFIVHETAAAEENDELTLAEVKSLRSEVAELKDLIENLDRRTDEGSSPPGG